MKRNTFVICTVALVGMLVLSVGEAKVKCSGDCAISIDGRGVSERTGDVPIVGPSEFNTAKDRSIDDTKNRCNAELCAQNCGGSSSDWTANRSGHGDTGTPGVYWGRSWDGLEVEVISEGGKNWWNIYTSGMCMCQQMSNESCEAGDCLLAESRGRRVELTTTQKVLKVYEQAKQSLFKRLFGRN